MTFLQHRGGRSAGRRWLSALIALQGLICSGTGCLSADTAHRRHACHFGNLLGFMLLQPKGGLGWIPTLFGAGEGICK